VTRHPSSRFPSVSDGWRDRSVAYPARAGFFPNKLSEPKLGLLRTVFCESADPTGRGVAEATGALRGQRDARHVQTVRKGVVTGCTYLLFPASCSRFPSIGRITISQRGEKAMSTTIDVTNAAVFERRESDVRSYCSKVDAIFATASGSSMRDGREYIDFLSGAGSLNYGHNDLQMIAAGRYNRIPAGHDARGIASSDARRGDKTPSRSPHAAARSGGVPPCPSIRRLSSNTWCVTVSTHCCARTDSSEQRC
jgi:hypothetical protein